MQTSPQTQPATAPAAPAAPGAPVSITTPGPDGQTLTLPIPQTREAIDQLLAQRRELSDQLSNVSDRRSELAREIFGVPDGASRTGLEARVRVLDQRIVQLETDLAAVGRQLSAAPSELVSFTEQNPNSGGDDFETGFSIAAGLSIFVMLPVVLFFARRRWKRKFQAAPAAQPVAESANRLERLEQGMESIAIEIERISEGQRFVTRLLSESQTPVGTAHRIAQPVPVERDA